MRLLAALAALTASTLTACAAPPFGLPAGAAAAVVVIATVAGRAGRAVTSGQRHRQRAAAGHGQHTLDESAHGAGAMRTGRSGWREEAAATRTDRKAHGSIPL